MGKFIRSVDAKGEYRFKLLAENDEVVLVSEGYTQEAGRDNGIESVRAHAADDARYELKTAVDGQYYFNLKASNGQVIGTSETYRDEEGRANGIASVKRNAPTATVE